MKFSSRRDFLRRSVGTALFSSLFATTTRSGRGAESPDVGVMKDFEQWSVDRNRVQFRSVSLTKPAKLMMIADTHLYRDDERGVPFKQYSDRMAHAYNVTKHFRTGVETNPEESLLATLELAKAEGVDHMILLGDMVSFPSEAGVDWLHAKLEETGIPWLYVAGNHDWHYEGLPGTEIDLRNEWIEKRLTRLYRGMNPLYDFLDIGDLRVLMVDDSVYEILPEQLEFLQTQIATGKPLILCMHIPLYAPGRGVGFGVGHPDWNKDHDMIYKVERRPQWPEEGPSPTAYAFRNAAFSAPNMLGIFTGHIHQFFIDVIKQTPQIVVPSNSNGDYVIAEFLPTK